MTTAEEARIDVTAWLRQTLANCAAESAHIKVIASQAGIGPKALRNARERIGVVATRQGNGATMRSVWSLPGEGSRMSVQTDADGIRAPAIATVPLSTFVKVAAADEALKVDRVCAESTDRSGPRLLGNVGFGDLTKPHIRTEFDTPSRTSLDKPWKRWRVAAPAPAAAMAEVRLTEGERRRTEARIGLFVLRGLAHHEAQQLAGSLVERDRNAGQAVGSCIECQNFVRNECAVPKPASIVHECWSRRHDAP